MFLFDQKPAQGIKAVANRKRPFSFAVPPKQALRLTLIRFVSPVDQGLWH
jgi:hypothetical protein